jgi:hypothetical protein
VVNGWDQRPLVGKHIFLYVRFLYVQYDILYNINQFTDLFSICHFHALFSSSLDVSKWEAVVGSTYGRDQPFYRVIPDEDDVQEFLKDKNAFRSTYYVAQVLSSVIHHLVLSQFIFIFIFIFMT